MNEELKIIIKAVTDGAKKSLAGVRDALDDVRESGESASKAIDNALKGIGKSVAIAVGAITALTTALVALGKRSLEFQKTQAKLNSAFQSMGGSAEQATKTYKDLYRFLGDDATATEAAQSLARITTNEKDLAEWTQILQGAYATMGDALPVEGLAEAANETIKAGVASGSLVDALVWLGVSEDEFNAKLATTNNLEEREALLRSTLNSLYGNAAKIYERNNQALLNYNESQVNLNITMAQAASYTTPLLTELNNLGATLLTVLAPALSTVAAYMTAFIQLIAEAIAWVGNFFGLFGGGSDTAKADIAGYRKAMDDYTASLRKGFQKSKDSVEGVNNQIKELKKQTMGFDELNILQAQPASAGTGAGGGGGGTGYDIPAPPNPADFGMDGSLFGLEGFTEDIEKAKEKIKAVLSLIGLVAAGLVAWKITGFLEQISLLKEAVTMGSIRKIKFPGGTWEDYAPTKEQLERGKEAQKQLDIIKDRLLKAAGIIAIAAGAILLVSGYSDAWINGLDWGNFATMLAGIGLIVGGLVMAVSPLAGAIATIVGGIALVVIGIKDLIENGYSMEAVITVTVGAILVLVGAVWALNAALLANPITWIVVAIMALVATFVILWNECEGFRNFWINLWEKIKVLFAKFVESIQPLIDAIVFAFQQAWELIKVIWMDYLVPIFKLAWELIKAVWDGVKPYFQLIWDNIKLIFSIVGDVLSGYFKVAWEYIKAVWNVAVSYFTTVIKNIGLAFGVVKDLLSGNFSAAWEKIKQIFSNIGSFFGGVINTIKNTFKNIATIVGDTISSVVKKAINGVLSNAVKIINGFISAINLAISVINAIPGVSISRLKKLDVPKLATGGIVGSATIAMIGERGKEAVLPLENNTGWMDTLADRIASRNNTPSKIVLMVDGRELGYASLNSINDITRQTGKLQLVLA